MKIIDEKGRLFGRINVIDFLVILFLFCFIPMFYFGYRLFKKPVVVSVTQYPTIEIEINCNSIKVKPEILKLITVGDKEMDGSGAIIGEIIEIGETKPYQYKIDIGGEVLTKEDPVLKEIPIRLKVKTEIRNNELYYKNRKIVLNSPMEFKTAKYTLEVILVKNKKEIKKAEWVKLVVKFIGVIPEVAKIIQEGDIEKDPENNIAAKLKTIVSNKASDILLLKEERWITVTHPFQKDVVVILELSCVEKEGILYFKNYPVKMGNSVTFTTDLYSISGVITGVEYL